MPNPQPSPTGQVQQTVGGNRTFSAYSGAVGADAVIVTGGGRLDKAFFHGGNVLGLSGLPVVFYDSAVPVSGGPIVASGHKIVGVLSFPLQTLASGNAFYGGSPVDIGVVFSSGLCHSSRSGQIGFTASYTPNV